MADPIQAQIAAMQSQVLSSATPQAAKQEAQRLAGSSGPYQQVGIDYLQGKRTALNTVNGMMAGGGGSSSSVTSSVANNRASELQGRINAASGAFKPELIAGYTDASGTWHPPTYTRPAPGQEVSGSLQGPSGTFDPGLISGDPRYQLLEQQRKALEDRKATVGQDVEAAYAAQEAGMRGLQNRQKGAAAMQLARMGALGTTGSGLDYLQSQDRRHAQEMYDLGIQKARAVEQAKYQLDQQQFDLVEKQLAVADQIQERYEQSKQRQIDNLIKYRQLEKYERDDARETLQTIIQAGVTKDALPDDYLNQMDAVQGLPFGTTSRLFDLAEQEREAKAAEAQFEREGKMLERQKTIQELEGFAYKQANELIGILSKTREGGTVSIDGYDYTVLGNTDNLQTGMQIDEAGMGVAYTFDKATGQYSVQNLGKIGAAKDQWQNIETNQGWMRQNLRTGELIPLDTTTNQFQSEIPDGVVWGESWGRANAGQCGAFVNDLTGLGVGDSWKSKQQKCDPTIGTSANPINVGDVIVQKMGTTGHVAIINSMKEVPVDPQDPSKGTKLMLRLSESNYVPPNGRKTSSTRWVDARDPSITGFARGELPSFLASGTDTLSGTSLSIVTPEDKRLQAEIAREERAISREERAQLNKTIPTDMARELGVPVDTKYSDLVGRGLVLPPKKEGVTYEYREMTDSNGQTSLYAINKADPKDMKPVTFNPESVSTTSTQGRNISTGDRLTILSAEDKKRMSEEKAVIDPKTFDEWAKTYPSSGILPTDTLGEARAKIAQSTQSKSASGLTPVARNQYETAINLIGSISRHPGLRGAVGIKGPSSLFGLKGVIGLGDEPIAGTAAADFVADLKTLQANLTAPNLSQLRGLGAMSDRELKLIESAVGNLDRSRSEDGFFKELRRIDRALRLTVAVPGPDAGSIYVKKGNEIGWVPKDEYLSAKSEYIVLTQDELQSAGIEL